MAFANAEGGTIAIGLSEGRIEGIGEHDENGLRQAARTFTDPPVRHRFRLVSCTTSDGRSDRVALMEIEASESVHRMANGDVFLRVGDENRRLAALEVLELEYDKGQSVFDGRAVPGATLADFADDLVVAYLSQLRAATPAEDVLEARGMVVRRSNQFVPTTAGILLLCAIPQRFFPEAWVRVLEYRGAIREVGSRANVAADDRFEGPLTRQIEDVAAALRSRIASVIQLAGSGRFERTPVIPEDAWLETVVNAVAHRSYSMAGDHIRIELFSNRFEAESPGRLPGLVRIETIRSTRFARNPRIARALADYGYGRELGEGVDRMFVEMERAGLPDPRYEQMPASVRVTLLADPAMARPLRSLSERRQLLYSTIARAGRITSSEAARVLGQSRPTVLRSLYALEEVGLIERVGVTNDPHGYWRPTRPPVG